MERALTAHAFSSQTKALEHKPQAMCERLESQSPLGIPSLSLGQRKGMLGLMHPLLQNLSDNQRQSLDTLVEIFLKENSITNLSALRTKEACFTGNILDSLAFSLLTDQGKIPKQGTLIDIGTGGGFPLLPIAITHSSLQCTGFDAVKKKIAAVERMAKELGLSNVNTHGERTEVAGRDKNHRERYDIVTARAVAPLAILLEYCSPFAKVGGFLVCWKSTHIDEERQAAEAAMRVLGLQDCGTVTYELPDDFGTRQLLMFKKTAPTPAIYPRSIGEAKHHPITDR